MLLVTPQMTDPFRATRSGRASLHHNAESPKGCQEAKRALFGSLNLTLFLYRSHIVCSCRSGASIPLMPHAFCGILTCLWSPPRILITFDDVLRSMIGYEPWAPFLNHRLQSGQRSLARKYICLTPLIGVRLIEHERLYPGYSVPWEAP